MTLLEVEKFRTYFESENGVGELFLDNISATYIRPFLIIYKFILINNKI